MTLLLFPPRTALFTPVYSGKSPRGIPSCPPVQTQAASHTPVLPGPRPTSPRDGNSCTHTLPAPFPCAWQFVCSHSLHSTWLILELRSDHRLSAQDPGMVSHSAHGRRPRPHRAPEAPSGSAPLPLCTPLLLHASHHATWGPSVQGPPFLPGMTSSLAGTGFQCLSEVTHWSTLTPASCHRHASFLAHCASFPTDLVTS